jgi:tetratricopeptide (TPR) repeat protein
MLLAQRARAAARQGRWPQALKEYETAVRLAPDNTALLLEAARVFAQHKQPDLAADTFAKAAASSPTDAALWVETARELVRLEQWDRAAEHFLHAIDLQPAEHGVGAARAATCRELAHSPLALDRALRERPNDTDVLTGRARVRIERGEWKEAATDFARVVELSPPDERSFECAAVLLILGDEAGYRKVVTRLVEQIGDTRDPFLAYVLARTCSLVPNSGIDAARAVAWAEQAVAERPKVGWYLHALGLALYRKGEFEAAIGRLTESEKADWEPVMDWLVLALCHHRLGHAAEARKYLARATELLARRPPAKLFTAALFSTDVEEAVLMRREADRVILGKEK